MQFTKLHGAGNDFVLVEDNNTHNDWSQLARTMCDRHFGIGADGLLLLSPSKIADFRMRIFDADGSESNVCGNGLRCTIKHFLDNNPGGSINKEISVETMAGIRKARLFKFRGKVTEIQTGMGEPRFGEMDIPITVRQDVGKLIDLTPVITCSVTVNGRELYLNLVSVGNSHAVYFSRSPVADFPLSEFGPQVELHKIFPEGVNFEVARVLDRKRIEARVWERGVGETLACGSGACAITVAAQLLDYVDNKVDIILPGGTLEVEWDKVGEVFLNGPAETVFTGEWLDGHPDQSEPTNSLQMRIS